MLPRPADYASLQLALWARTCDSAGRARRHRCATMPMPELPEVETTRRGLAPHLDGRRVDRRRAAPARPALADPAGDRRAAAGRDASTRSAAAPSTCCSTPTPGSALLHLGMSGIAARAAGDDAGARRTTTSTSALDSAAGCCASTIRAASAACSGSRRARPTNCCGTSVRSRCRTTSTATTCTQLSRGRSAPVKTFLMDQAHRGRRRQHLRRRERCSAPASRRRARPARSRASATRGSPTAVKAHPRARDRARRHHPARLHQPGRRARLFRAGTVRSTAARANPAGAAAGRCSRRLIGQRATRLVRPLPALKRPPGDCPA